MRSGATTTLQRLLFLSLVTLGCLIFAALLRHDQPNAPRPATHSGEVAVQVPSPRFSLPPIDQFSETVSRPLFLESRRPADGDAEQDETLVRAAPSVVRKDANAYRLTGVVISRGEAVALLQGGGDEPVTRLRVGESLDNWSVEHIYSDRVLLVDGREKREIALWRFEPLPPPKSRRGRAQTRNSSRGATRAQPTRRVGASLPGARDGKGERE